MRHATLTVLMMTAFPLSLPHAQSTDTSADLAVNDDGAVARAPSIPPKFQDRAPNSTSAQLQSVGNRDPNRDRSLRPCSDKQSLSPGQAEDLVRRVATEENFYPDFVVAIARRGYHFDAAPASPARPYGLLQLSQPIAARFGVDRCKPEDNVRGGVRYLRHLQARYRNPLHILAAYHAGEDAVTEHKGMPPFPDTVRYVADVMNDFYGWPSAGADKPVPPATDGDRPRQATAKLHNAPTRPTSASPKPPDWLVLHVE